jgi:hypothetical protein
MLAWISQIPLRTLGWALRTFAVLCVIFCSPVLIFSLEGHWANAVDAAKTKRQAESKVMIFIDFILQFSISELSLFFT